MALKIDAKFEKKLTCAFKKEMRNLENFHRLKNSDFILESKIVELNQNKNLKQLDLPDAVRKVILIWKLISTINKTFHICFTESFFKV